MKSLIRNRLAQFITVAGLLFATVSQAPAQTKKEAATQWTDKKFDTNTQFIVEFPGGTIPEYLDRVQAAAQQAGYHGPLNIVVTESAREIRLPSIEIKTNMDGAVGCLEACSTDSRQIIAESSSGGNLHIIKLVDRNPPIVQVMNVKAIIKDIKQEDFVSAIGIGLEMAAGDREGVEMKLHDETGLFFVKGTRDRLQVITQIVNQLGPTPSNHAIYNNPPPFTQNQNPQFPTFGTYSQPPMSTPPDDFRPLDDRLPGMLVPPNQGDQLPPSVPADSPPLYLPDGDRLPSDGGR